MLAGVPELWTHARARVGQQAEVGISMRGDRSPHLGLGLFMARLIVERHGGAISAFATATGSCFRVQLPRR
ncbi:MAG: hypothetical protein RQ741_03345 [Wenzhouxiangellaceae bacterium]|nr:hypothetical protein [Wenzhouxiangellaceae bacterium]